MHTLNALRFASLAFGLGLAAALPPVFAAQAPKTHPQWPTRAWTTATLPATPACKALEATLGDAVLVGKDGALLVERYDAPHGRETPEPLGALSRTVTATLLATAVYDRRIAFDERVANYYQTSMQATLGELAVYGAGSGGDLARAMLYGDDGRDMAAYAAKQQSPEGNAVLVMGVLKKVYLHEYDAMPWKQLFDVLGMEHAVFERDGANVFVGSSFAHLRGVDLAKLGFLYLNDGLWDGRRLLPEGWAARTFKNVTEHGFVRIEGDRGQYLAYHPKLNLVLARVGQQSFDAHDFEKAAEACFK